MHEPMTVEDAAIELGARISTVRRRAALMHLPKFGKAYQISFAALEQMRVALAAPAKRGPRAAGLIEPAAALAGAGALRKRAPNGYRIIKGADEFYRAYGPDGVCIGDAYARGDAILIAIADSEKED